MKKALEKKHLPDWLKQPEAWRGHDVVIPGD